MQHSDDSQPPELFPEKEVKSIVWLGRALIAIGRKRSMVITVAIITFIVPTITFIVSYFGFDSDLFSRILSSAFKGVPLSVLISICGVICSLAAIWFLANRQQAIRQSQLAQHETDYNAIKSKIEITLAEHRKEFNYLREHHNTKIVIDALIQMRLQFANVYWKERAEGLVENKENDEIMPGYGRQKNELFRDINMLVSSVNERLREIDLAQISSLVEFAGRVDINSCARHQLVAILDQYHRQCSSHIDVAIGDKRNVAMRINHELRVEFKKDSSSIVP